MRPMYTVLGINHPFERKPLRSREGPSVLLVRHVDFNVCPENLARSSAQTADPRRTINRSFFSRANYGNLRDWSRGKSIHCDVMVCKDVNGVTSRVQLLDVKNAILIGNSELRGERVIRVQQEIRVKRNLGTEQCEPCQHRQSRWNNRP